MVIKKVKSSRFKNELAQFSLDLIVQAKSQGNTYSLFDSFCFAQANILKNNGNQKARRSAELFFQSLFKRRKLGRFADYFKRLSLQASDIDEKAMASSQGTLERLTWKGLPLFKSVYDFVLYPMLISDLKPKTVVEIGSGTGASASWLADLANNHREGAKVYSIDIVPPKEAFPNVTFIEGDSNKISNAIGKILNKAPHPWLVVEDAHINVDGVMRYFHPKLQKGDYIIIEDSFRKHRSIKQFMKTCGDLYRVDTKFTDFFGHNATSARDSIFKRVK